MLIVDGAAKKWFGCVSTGGGAGEGRWLLTHYLLLGEGKEGASGRYTDSGGERMGR